MKILNENVSKNIMKNLKEEYSESLGGDPEDFIGDMNQVIDTLNPIRNSFGTHLGAQIVDDFIDSCESKIDTTIKQYNLNIKNY